MQLKIANSDIFPIELLRIFTQKISKEHPENDFLNKKIAKRALLEVPLIEESYL